MDLTRAEQNHRAYREDQVCKQMCWLPFAGWQKANNQQSMKKRIDQLFVNLANFHSSLSLLNATPKINQMHGASRIYWI